MKYRMYTLFILFSIACGSFLQCSIVILGESNADEHSSIDASTDRTLCKEGAQRSCYTGPPSTKDKGVCQSGRTRCKEGRWGSCIEQVLPASAELCGDKKDNDCDGQTDEGCGECTDGERRGCYTHSRGCTTIGSTYLCKTPCKAGSQICIKGQWETSCTGQQGPAVEVCDKKDNDCDGKVDNIKEQGDSCDTGEPSLCRTGKIQCSPFGRRICKADNKAQPEICNGKDDDCDGEIDESFAGKDIPCQISQKGECKAGTWTCTSGQKSCRALHKPTPERCNGKDDDCDGKTDIGCVSTFAGTAGAAGFIDGVGQAARLHSPTGLAFDASGNLYVADTNNHAIRKITPSGHVSTFLARTGIHKALYKIDGLKIKSPAGLYIQKNDLYIAMSGSDLIVKVNLTTGTSTSSSLGTIKGPQDVIIGAKSLLYVSDTENGRIQKASNYFAQPIDFISPIKSPVGLAYNPIQKWLYVSTDHNNGITLFDAQGNKKRSETSSEPRHMVFSGNKLYVASHVVHGIGVMDADLKNRILFAGQRGQSGTQDGYRTQARFNLPWGITVSPRGDLYISDAGAHTIRKIRMK